MPTELLYLDRPYETECISTVTQVEFTDLVVDRSIFFPTGFGQPNDRGKVIIDGKEFVIAEAWSDGLFVHLMSLYDPYPQDIAGKSVKQVIDWNIRHIHMRFRSAMFLVAGIAYEKLKCLTRMNETYDDQSWIDLLTDKDLSDELVKDIEAAANEKMASALPITSRYISKEEFARNGTLMFLNKNSIPDYEKIRVTEIPGLATQFDMGIQVKNTSEIGKITIKTTLVKGKINKRLIINLAL
ncbi:MAG: alanyl-tRNA editing protein [Candidatus Thermoplasmatota archaeon]|jgi:alanyl-tRNA synthetase/misacylated tRNA(Ala) deacylase|nr:alanyl-tRNA editing protein [Candidatus Thermoplasmatota archaeon]MCL5800264.1 alanyl-tRNA editing protein [Candidatus Thermoplasmatota archaeon]